MHADDLIPELSHWNTTLNNTLIILSSEVTIIGTVDAIPIMRIGSTS